MLPVQRRARVTSLSHMEKDEVDMDKGMQADGKILVDACLKKKTSPKERKWSWALRALCLGQVLAVCNALSGIVNQSISNKTNNKEAIPACQTALNYVFLCLTFGIYHLKTHGFSRHFTRAGLKCLANALIDVQAWYWIYKSYNFTTLTSVQSLDCLSIPVAIAVSKLFLGRVYTYQQYGAVVLSIGGLVLIVYSDYDPADKTTAEGDLMCTCGAILFGVSTVCQEWILEEMDTYQYMGTVCWYAAAISSAQVVLLERPALRANIAHNPHLGVWMVALAMSQFIFYSAMPLMLNKFGSAAATLNLLAADAYAALAGALLFKLAYDGAYIGGMLVTILGILLYTLSSDTRIDAGLSDESSEALIE